MKENRERRNAKKEKGEGINAGRQPCKVGLWKDLELKMFCR